MIEFVSPRPYEDEEGRMEEDGSLPGGGITLGYSKFQDIPEEIKEEEDFESDRY